MSFLDRLLGRPLSTHEEAAHHIGLATGIPVLGLDALSSAAYPERYAMSSPCPTCSSTTISPKACEYRSCTSLQTSWGLA